MYDNIIMFFEIDEQVIRQLPQKISLHVEMYILLTKFTGQNDESSGILLIFFYMLYFNFQHVKHYLI